jgi:hypothetical protein
MSDAAARAAVDAIVERDHLRLPVDEYERLVRIYGELQDQLAAMRAPEFRDAEPATIFHSE